MLPCRSLPFSLFGWPFNQASNVVAKPETTKPSLTTLTFLTLKCELNSCCSVRVCREQSFPIKDFFFLMLCNSSNSEDPHQTRRHPVPLLGLCSAPASACTGRKKHNKLQSRPTEEFPQPLPLRGQIIINRRLNNSEPSEWMPCFGPFLGTCSERLPLRLHVCMYVCMYVCMCAGYVCMCVRWRSFCGGQ